MCIRDRVNIAHIEYGLAQRERSAKRPLHAAKHGAAAALQHADNHGNVGRGPDKIGVIHFHDRQLIRRKKRMRHQRLLRVQALRE